MPTKKPQKQTKEPSSSASKTQQSIRYDYSLILSVFALVIAGWAAYESHEARLDSKRSQLRNEALEIIADIRSATNTFNCYALVKGVDLSGKEDFQHFLADKEHQIRKGIGEIATFSSSALAIYEESLNDVKGKARTELNEKLTLIRASWDKSLRDQADSVCKF